MSETGTMAHRLRMALEADILEGRLRPGDELDERGIAERFDVSRTPVKQALTLLASAGLVAMRPRQKSIVTPISVADLAQMFEVLAGLEALAAELAARRMSTAQLESLEALHEDIREVVASNDPGAYAALNARFHEQVWAGAHNPYLAEQLSGLRLRLAPYRRWLIEKMDRMRRSFREHEDLLHALREGDEAAASDAMRRHVQDGDRFVDFMMIDGARGK